MLMLDGDMMTISLVMADGGEASISNNSVNVAMVDKDDSDGCVVDNESMC